MYKEVFQKSFSMWTPVLKKTWHWLLFSLGSAVLLDGAVGFVVGDGGDPQTSQLRLSLTLISFALQLLLAAVILVIINNACESVRENNSQSPTHRFTEYFKYILIESARALPPILLRCLLLLIPGIIEGIRLYFISYVVMFDKDYKSNQADALVRSRALVKGHMWGVSFVLIFAFAISMVGRLAMIQAWAYGLHLFALGFFGALCIELWTYTLSYSLYIELEKRRGTNGN
jgi:hypothetical protein